MSQTPNIIPILVYADIKAGHDHLVDVLGFTSGGLHEGEDGSVVHGEVSLGDRVIWLHRVAGEHDMASPSTLSANHGGLSVHIADVDAHYAKAKAAGATVDYEPTDQPYGVREYGTRDPEGHRFWFATALS